MTDHDHGPPGKGKARSASPATGLIPNNLTTKPTTSHSTSRLRVYAQEKFADLGLFDDGSAAGADA
jgi:hypothetical protein